MAFLACFRQQFESYELYIWSCKNVYPFVEENKIYIIYTM